MRGFHFSLRWLFGVVSFLAVGCGLLIYASPFLSKLTFTAAIVILLAAILSAVYQAGNHRAFWTGFAAFGFAYLWLTCGLWQSPDGSTPLRERLVTNDLLVRCHEVLPSRQTSVTLTSAVGAPVPAIYAGTVFYDQTGNVAPGITMPPGSTIMTTATVTTSVDRTDFLTTGHSLVAIVFALLGGVIARGSFRRAHTTVSKD